MSQENVEAFKRGVDAMNHGDIEGMLEFCDPEVAWRDAINAMFGGKRHCIGDTTPSVSCSETCMGPSPISIPTIRMFGTWASGYWVWAASACAARRAGPRLNLL